MPLNYNYLTKTNFYNQSINHSDKLTERLTNKPNGLPWLKIDDSKPILAVFIVRVYKTTIKTFQAESEANMAQ